MINKIKEDIRLEKIADHKALQKADEADRLGAMDRDGASHMENSKIMTTLFPDIIRNQQDLIRKHGDTTHYAQAMEQALIR